ncbi:MAG: hypothetical protein ACO1TE_28930 [Prosthecobacter sp.]
MNTNHTTVNLTTVKNENDEAATAPTVTASKPETESRENSPEGLIQDESALALVNQVPETEPSVADNNNIHVKAATPSVAPMTMEEIEKREQCIQIVRKSLDGVREGVGALMEIRELGLWRGTHDSFAAFCRDVFDISEPRASQLISHAHQCIELKKAKFTDDQIPTSERAIRELRRVKAGDRVKVFEKALELAGGVRPKTAHVLEARAAIEGVKEAENKAPKPQVITPEDAMSAAETLKQFLEKCERDNLKIGEANKIGELTKGIADLAVSRGLAA